MKISKKIIAAALATSMMASMSATTSAEEVMLIEEPVEEIIIETPAYGNYVSVSSSTEKTDKAALDEKLAEITLSVRNELQIGDEYTSFNSDLSENVTSRIWYLDWSSDDKAVSVQAAEDGTVMRYRKNYYDSRNTYQSYNNFYNPKFQTTTAQSAKKAAETFLRRVLNENEGYVFTNTDTDTLSPMGVDEFYLSAKLTVNGLETPFNINIRVNADTLEVIYFNRNDNNDSYMGDYPTASSNYEEKNAFESLSKKFDNTLKYYIVYDKDDTERKNPKAELQYKFYSTGDWFFDAKTGETINRNDLYDEAYNSSLKGEFGMTSDSVTMEEAAPESANGGYQLTEVELESIEKMKDIISGEEITKIINEKYPEFGLDGFELISTSYTRNVETDEVKANLSFSKIVTKGDQIGMSEEEFKASKENKNIYYIRKNITADGKTGELFSYNTSYPYVNEKHSNNKTYKTDSLSVAEKFLTKHFSEEFGSSALTNTYSNNIGTHTTYTFTHTVNGYTLDQNWLSVRVNNITGDIDTYSKAWVYGVEFESPKGIISAEEALEIYATSYTAKLQYITVPVAIDPQKPEFTPYINAGWNSYVLSFKTAYKLNEDFYAYGVKAKDGTILKSEEYVQQSIAFTDIENCESKEKIEALAAYGITFGETEFKPKNLLNQRDMLIYLLNSVGNRFSVLSYENAEDSDLDYLYDQAVYYGFITADERDPDKLIRKEDLAKAIVRPSEYNAATTLEGLFKANYADKADATEGYLPYLAVAEALGIIEADGNNIDPDTVMTREDLAKAVYALMDR